MPRPPCSRLVGGRWGAGCHCVDTEQGSDRGPTLGPVGPPRCCLWPDAADDSVPSCGLSRIARFSRPLLRLGAKFGRQLPEWPRGVWRNGSASDSRSEGWELESLCPQRLLTTMCRPLPLPRPNRAHRKGEIKQQQAGLLPPSPPPAPLKFLVVLIQTSV